IALIVPPHRVGSPYGTGAPSPAHTCSVGPNRAQSLLGSCPIVAKGGGRMVRNLTPEEELARHTFSSWWWILVVDGILWLLFGFLVLSLRPASVAAVIVAVSIGFWLGAFTLFAISGLLHGFWRVLAIVGGVVSTGAGIAAIAWPGPTLVVVSDFVAWYLLVR